MSWLYLFIAGMFEVTFVTCMKLANGFKNKRYTVLSIITGGLSFYFLSLAMLAIPLGTAYAIWSGMGAAGSVLIGMLFFNESKSMIPLFFISLIMLGVIGMKMTS